MKRTDKERIERSLKRIQKRERNAAKREAGRADNSIGGYAKSLNDLLQFDDIQVYNTLDDEDVLELLMEMKEDLPEKQWETVIRKAVKMTNVKEKEQAVGELKGLLQ